MAFPPARPPPPGSLRGQDPLHKLQLPCSLAERLSGILFNGAKVILKESMFAKMEIPAKLR